MYRLIFSWQNPSHISFNYFFEPILFDFTLNGIAGTDCNLMNSISATQLSLMNVIDRCDLLCFNCRTT